MGFSYFPRSIAAIVIAAGICVAAHSRAQLVAGRISADADHILVDGAPIFLKGIDYSPFVCGDAPWTDINQLHVDFLHDLREIRETLHANAVRVYVTLPRAFYNAARTTGLWVIQGFYMPDSPDFIAALPDRIRDLDAGLETVYAEGGDDVILAYAIGSGFSTQSVAATVAAHQGDPRFHGTFYSAPGASELPPINCYDPDCQNCPHPEATPPVIIPPFPDPHPFQSFLAALADHVATYESAAGRHRHLIGHAITSASNPFLGSRDRVAPQIDLPVDLSFLDVIFENSFTYAHPYIAYFGFPAYIEGLKNAYPTRPVVILETGYSTSPAGAVPPPPPLCGYPYQTPQPLTLSFGGASDADQALALEARYVDVTTCRRPLAGFFVYEFYDEWWFGGAIGVQNPDLPLEHFGLKRIQGTPAACTAANKPAYQKIADLYGCEEPLDAAGECQLVLRSPRLLEGVYGVPLDIQLEARGGTPPYRFGIDPVGGDPSGALPLGVTLDEGTGKLSGLPERMGDFRFRLHVTDHSSGNALRRERLEVMRIGPPVFAVRGREILMNGEPFYLKGVDYSPYIAGDAPWTAVRVADPFVDFKEIKERLHANTVRLYRSAPKTVYDAARQNGLFVIQGIHLQIDCKDAQGKLQPCPSPGDELCKSTDPDELRPFDLYDPERHEAMKEQVLGEVDEIDGSGAADTILCWVVGNEVNFCIQRATIILNQARPVYQGNYPIPDPSPLPVNDQYDDCGPQTTRFWPPHPFQSFISEMVDVAIDREGKRYHARHLMAHATEPNMSIAVSAKDRFFPDQHFPVDMGFLDIVFQNTYSYFPPAIRYFGYEHYLQLCAAAYPDVPFVILECGYSVSPEHLAGSFTCASTFPCQKLTDRLTPDAESFCYGENSEVDQARALALQYQHALGRSDADGGPLTAGYFIFEYFDEWWKASDPSKGPYVQDRDRSEEWFGIKSVSGTRDQLTIADRPAFETVGRMFDPSPEPSGCPRSGDLQAEEAAGGGVKLTLAAGGWNSAVLTRDGQKIGSLTAGQSEFTDPAPPPGDRLYRAVAQKSFVDCPPLEITFTVKAPPGARFRRGDIDTDGAFNITDPIVLLNALFLGGAQPPCPDAADVDDNGALEVTDPINALNRLFLGGAAPADPGPDTCGVDPTDDRLAPCEYPAAKCP